MGSIDHLKNSMEFDWLYLGQAAVRSEDDDEDWDDDDLEDDDDEFEDDPDWNSEDLDWDDDEDDDWDDCDEDLEEEDDDNFYSVRSFFLEVIDPIDSQEL